MLKTVQKIEIFHITIHITPATIIPLSVHCSQTASKLLPHEFSTINFDIDVLAACLKGTDVKQTTFYLWAHYSRNPVCYAEIQYIGFTFLCGDAISFPDVHEVMLHWEWCFKAMTHQPT